MTASNVRSRSVKHLNRSTSQLETTTTTTTERTIHRAKASNRLSVVIDHHSLERVNHPMTASNVRSRSVKHLNRSTSQLETTTTTPERKVHRAKASHRLSAVIDHHSLEQVNHPMTASKVRSRSVKHLNPSMLERVEDSSQPQQETTTTTTTTTTRRTRHRSARLSSNKVSAYMKKASDVQNDLESKKDEKGE
jgi:acetyl-CoA carboxylase beta subunit